VVVIESTELVDDIVPSNVRVVKVELGLIILARLQSTIETFLYAKHAKWY